MIALGFLFWCAGGYMAVSAGNEAAVSNHISTGIIDIELEEHQIKNGKEAKWQDNPLLLPGADVSKIPRIHNRGSDCYVRASIGFRDLAVDLERHIYGLGGSWVKKSDGYYYYTDILKTGESSGICSKEFRFRRIFHKRRREVRSIWIYLWMQYRARILLRIFLPVCRGDR